MKLDSAKEYREKLTSIIIEATLKLRAIDDAEKELKEIDFKSFFCPDCNTQENHLMLTEEVGYCIICHSRNFGPTGDIGQSHRAQAGYEHYVLRWNSGRELDLAEAEKMPKELKTSDGKIVTIQMTEESFDKRLDFLEKAIDAMHCQDLGKGALAEIIIDLAADMIGEIKEN